MQIAIILNVIEVFMSDQTFLSLMVLIMKFANCSSFSTVTPTPLYTSSLFFPAGQYCTHITWKTMKNLFLFKRSNLYVYNVTNDANNNMIEVQHWKWFSLFS